MTDKVDPAVLENLIKEAAKDPAALKTLTRVFKQLHMDGSRETRSQRDMHKAFEEGFEEGKKKAEEAGKGKGAATRAGMKAGREREEQFQLATMGTKRSKRSEEHTSELQSH